MKVAAAIAVLLAVSVSAADKAPATPPQPGGTAAKAAAGTATAVIPVKGMSCGGCVAHVNEELQKLPGVKRVDTSLDDARTTVVYDPAKVKPADLVKAIAATGYEPGEPAVK